MSGEAQKLNLLGLYLPVAYIATEVCMSDRQLSLPESVYQNLVAAAVMEGLTPVDWIAVHVPQSAPVAPPAGSSYKRFKSTGSIENDAPAAFHPESTLDLIGSLDSRRLSRPTTRKTLYEEILSEKMAKQSVIIP